MTDTGDGISPEFLPHVFDRFRQADPSITRHHGGLGLGLAIVKQLVELHGGQVSASSDGAGQGATFTVALPLTAARPLVAPDRPSTQPIEPVAETQRPQDDALSGLGILVVDDEPDSLALLRHFLEEYRAEVMVATSAAEAIALLQSQRPDVLISDIGMPGEDGYSLIRRVRTLAPEQGGETLAIALTAYARSEDRINALHAGFQHHLAKPVDPATLIALVAGAMRDAAPR